MQGIERRSGDREGLAAMRRTAIATSVAGASIPAAFPLLFPDCVFAPDAIAHPARLVAAGAAGVHGTA
jgi:hypothetical protein